MAGPTIFEIIKKHQKENGTWSTFWVKEKDLPRVAREIYESIPLIGVNREPLLQADIPSALMRGGITIGKTKLRVRPA